MTEQEKQNKSVGGNSTALLCSRERRQADEPADKPANREGKTRLRHRGTNEGQVQTIREIRGRK